jgi:HSP20 family protein
MSRNLFLADSASEGIKAKLDDGVLTVSVPKKEKPDKSVNIEIE